MAKLSNGFLGDASGKIGNVVFSKWRNIRTVRAYNGNPTDANSPAQQIQRIRMSALQAFLSPLNNNFIKFFNYKIALKSTPWAQAIKDNMPAVDKQGNIDLSKITFGNNKLPAAKILSSNYDPFIDCLTINFDYPGTMSYSDFQLVACSMLGMSKQADQPFDYNIDNMIKFMPSNYFYCEFFATAVDSEVFKNYFDRGQFWLIPLQNNRWDMMSNYIPSNTAPVAITPHSEIEDFNKDFSFNPVPTEAINIAYNVDKMKCDLQIKIKYELIDPEFSLDNRMKLYVRLIYKNGFVDLKPDITKLSSFPVVIGIDNQSDLISLIALYKILDEHEIQLTCFNKIYHGFSPDNIFTPYYDALFSYYNACPLSFKLPDTAPAVFGNLKELIPDFIAAYTAGSVTGKPEVYRYSDFSVHIYDSSGLMAGKAQIRKNSDFYFAGLTNSDYYYVVVITKDNLIGIYKKCMPELVDLWKRNFPQLIDAMSKPVKLRSNVSYISPSAVVYFHNQDIIPEAVMKSIKPYLINDDSWSIPIESYMKLAIMDYQASNPMKYKKTMLLDWPIAFDANLDN